MCFPHCVGGRGMSVSPSRTHAAWMSNHDCKIEISAVFSPFPSCPTLEYLILSCLSLRDIPFGGITFFFSLLLSVRLSAVFFLFFLSLSHSLLVRTCILFFFRQSRRGWCGFSGVAGWLARQRTRFPTLFFFLFSFFFLRELFLRREGGWRTESRRTRTGGGAELDSSSEEGR